MSEYENVAHSMIPLREISAAQRTWIEKNGALVCEFADVVFDNDKDALALLSFIVQSAAEIIWEARGERSHWRDLDVDRYAWHVARSPIDPGTVESIWMGLFAFLCWLVDTGRLRQNEANPILRNLDRRVGPLPKEEPMTARVLH